MSVRTYPTLFLSLGAFLIPYAVALVTCGVPLFLLEVSVGQYLGVGGMSVVGQLCPIFKGVGYSALMMVFLENVYYIIIVAWTLFYILNSIYSIGDSDGLPWASCDKGSEYAILGPPPGKSKGLGATVAALICCRRNLGKRILL